MKSPSTHRLSRRTFVQNLAAVGIVGVTSCVHDVRAGGILDAHIHLYDTRRPGGVPWPPSDDPVLYRPVLPDEFRALASPLSVRGALVVEASPWVDDNQWILDLIASDPFLVGFIGHLPVGESGFEPAWERYRRYPKFRGLRITGREVSEALHASRTQDHLAEIGRQGLSIDVLIGPDQLPEVATLADQFRSLRLVVDHGANVPTGPEPHPSRWVSGMAACHYTPNVAMKVSGLVEGTGKGQGNAPRDASVYRPILETQWHVLGEDRLIYASNWPVSARFAPYATVQGIATDFFEPLGREVTSKVFRKNAEHWYGVS